jgi:H+-transporting ATPase
MTDHRTDVSSSSSDAPDHLRTTIPSGGLSQGQENHPGTHGDSHETTHDQHDVSNEKAPTHAPTNEKAPAEEGDDEDIDALIAELESEDGELDEEEEAEPGMSARPIPEELLNTDTRKGLTSQEVTERRKKYGLNQMAEEKENLIKKFLGYFVGPIQFVMEVFHFNSAYFRLPLFLPRVFKIG